MPENPKASRATTFSTTSRSPRLVKAIKEERRIPTVSAVVSDGTLLESVLNPNAGLTAFALEKGEAWQFVDSVSIDASVRLVPYSARSNLLAHDVVLLPSAPEEYDSEQALLRDPTL